METLSRQARERSSTGLLRSDFIAYLSTFDDVSFPVLLDVIVRCVH